MSDLQALFDRIPAVLMVVSRIAGLMLYGPLFSAQIINARIRIFLAILIGMAVFPVIEAAHLPPTPWALDLRTVAPLIAREALVGVVVGFIATIPLAGVQVGALVIGQQMGLGLARAFNPVLNADANVVGQLLFFTTMAGFVMVGGHDALMMAVLGSYEHVPLGQFVVGMNLIDLLTGLLTAAMELAIRVAAPLLALIFLQTAALGFVAKTVPQFNILSLGFPLRILGGMLIVTLGLAVIDEVVMDAMSDTIMIINDYLAIGGG